ncbi:hypothetical protein O0L34_g16883 [Tuta absoluta]|nr:hypothetical protein O0L34_g16883 [Tuta absoluta]
MWTFSSLLLCLCASVVITDSNHSNESEALVLFYYGLEESERSLPLCEPRQACSAHMERSWRAPALVRLCRCARRLKCDARAPEHSRLEINHKAFFQFCHPVTSWPQCAFGETPLTVQTKYERLNPDELEELHHKNVQLVPPKIIVNCRCREPNYWRLNASTEFDDIQAFRCSGLPPCRTGDYCGNFNDLDALYQSCLCPRHHICVHNGGIPNHWISELMYRGRGWKAYCQRIGDYSDENYYDYE